MKGLKGKYLIITEDYTDSEVGVWSGWREQNSDSTPNSENMNNLLLYQTVP